MLKKLGFPMIALAAVMAFGAPRAADARVRIGVSIGAPAYVAPAPVIPYAYPNAYANPYVDPYAYAPPVYAAPAPAYVEPFVTFGGGWRGNDHVINRGGYVRGFDRGGHEAHGGHEVSHGRR